jgi:Putative abortive phage resistance protein AbiGi, antitoxin
MVQRYVSNELTHFVGRSLTTAEEQYRLLAENILASGKLGTLPDGSFQVLADGAAHPGGNEMISFPMVCFCDIPVADLNLHMKKYSRFGLAFKKAFLVPKGARPVFYVPRTTFGYGAGDFGFLQRFFNAEARLSLSAGPGGAVAGSSDEVQQLVKDLCWSARPIPLHVFGFMKFFDPKTTDTDPANYYMEREWRLPGMLAFDLQDVSTVILPSSFASRLRKQFPEYYGQVTFSD